VEETSLLVLTSARHVFSVILRMENGKVESGWLGDRLKEE
jgi:hypothetical protein